MSPVLAHEIVGPSTASRVVFVLHGIFGSGRNWRSFTGRLVGRIDDLRAIIVDLRNHGESCGFAGPHTMNACAEDLVRLAEHLGETPEAVIGHSFGGKVAALLAEQQILSLQQLWILDSPPGAGVLGRQPSDSEVGKLLSAMKSIALPVVRRTAVVEQIEARGISRAVAAWMGTNLVSKPGGFRWHFDLEAIEELLADYWRVDAYPAIESLPKTITTHCVVAEKSDRFSARDLARHEALAVEGKIRYHTLPDAGHWLHVDNPDGLLELMAREF